MKTIVDYTYQHTDNDISANKPDYTAQMEQV